MLYLAEVGDRSDPDVRVVCAGPRYDRSAAAAASWSGLDVGR